MDENKTVIENEEEQTNEAMREQTDPTKQEKIAEETAEDTETKAEITEETDETGEEKPQDDFDEFKISDGFKIYEEPQEEKPKPKKKKRRGLRTAIWIISIFAVSFAIAYAIIIAGADYLGFGKGQGDCVFIVKEGATTAQIAKDLNKAGVVKSPLLFRAYVKAKKYDGKFTSGRHVFSREAGYEAIAQELMKPSASAKTKRVTIVEGWDVDRIAKELEDKGICSRDDFIYEVQEGVFEYDFVDKIPVNQVHYRLEGYLFPDTYQFYYDDSKECAHLAVDAMLQNLNNKLKKEKINTNNITVFGKKYTFHEILTLSSIVEMEASKESAEMPKVAAVFFNRLRSSEFSTLGSSPTRNYPYGEGRYNTDPREADGENYAKGIPVGPMCCPGIDAIKAACSPKKDFDYYYFVTDKSMKFYYNKTLNEHNSTISKLQAADNWYYE